MPAACFVTDHCRIRWAERFPGCCLEDALARAARVGTDRLLRALVRRGRGFRYQMDSTYYADPVTRALFIVRPDSAVATVIKKRV